LDWALAALRTLSFLGEEGLEIPGEVLQILRCFLVELQLLGARLRNLGQGRVEVLGPLRFRPPAKFFTKGFPLGRNQCRLVFVQIAERGDGDVELGKVPQLREDVHRLVSGERLFV
jgi:hypothetical protein